MLIAVMQGAGIILGVVGVFMAGYSLGWKERGNAIPKGRRADVEFK